MNLVVCSEYRYDQRPDDTVWTQTVGSYSFWKRYLEVFDQVTVVARTRKMRTVDADFKRADGGRVKFVSVPYYVGPLQYALRSREVSASIQASLNLSDALVFRVPGQIASITESVIRSSSRPYGLEVVGDPHDTFAPGSVRHPFRVFFRWWFSRKMRLQCNMACAVAYVTEKALQRRYPPARGAFTTHYSSIELSDRAVASSPRSVVRESFPFTVITVGTLAQLYKAPHILIDSVAACVKEGLDLQLIMVGDGQYRMELEQRAKAQGLGHRVRFLGQLPAGDPIRTQLDLADLFVLPSMQEGLPRAMIEAMARALPCLGSTVGGIPELLPPEDMVPPGDVTALERKIREVVTNPERMSHMSARNLEKSRKYGERILREKRLAFYQYVRERTEEWLEEHV